MIQFTDRGLLKGHITRRLLMRIVFLLVHVTRRYKEVKRGLKGLLGIVKERIPPIPAGRTQGAGRIGQTRKGLWHILIRRMGQRLAVGVVGDTSDLGSQTGNAFEIRFHIRLPFAFHP